MIFEFCTGCAFNKDERCNFKYKDQLYSVNIEDDIRECNMYTTQEEFDMFLKIAKDLADEAKETADEPI